MKKIAVKIVKMKEIVSKEKPYEIKWHFYKKPKKHKRSIQTKLIWFPINKKDLRRLKLGLIKKPKTKNKKYTKQALKSQTIEI